MPIEQDALYVANFIKSLRQQIIDHPEYGRIYGEAGRLDAQIDRLATALNVNLDLLREANDNLNFFPNSLMARENKTAALQGLSATTLQIDMLWQQYRKGALQKTESLILQVEQQMPLQIISGATSNTSNGQDNTAQDTTDNDQGTENSTNTQGWFNSILTGMRQFQTFLTTAVGIKKAAEVWSPGLAGNVQQALDQLAQWLNLPH